MSSVRLESLGTHCTQKNRETMRFYNFEGIEVLVGASDKIFCVGFHGKVILDSDAQNVHFCNPCDTIQSRRRGGRAATASYNHFYGFVRIKLEIVGLSPSGYLI